MNLSVLALQLLFFTVSSENTDPYCPDGFTFELFTHDCFHISDALLSFDDAVDYCKEQAAALVATSYYSETLSIAELTKNLLTTVWLGTRRNATGTFVNIDGSFFEADWSPDEPSDDGDCVTQRSIGRVGMRAIPCYSLQPAVCRKEATTCNGGSFGGLHTNAGNITSPNYPDHYYNNLDCDYLITAPNGTYITINFSPYLVEDYDDYVTIYDGNSRNATVLGNITNSWSWTKKSFESSGNQILVRFVTDRAGTDHGWLAKWSAKNYQPVIRQYGYSGNFTSPNYPSNYPDYTEQIYYLSTDYGFKINVTFTDFWTEQGSDPLYLYDTYYPNSAKIMANISGYRTVPFSYVTTSNYLSMWFLSDGSINYRGFSGYWNIV